jgi:hypothetical protein
VISDEYDRIHKEEEDYPYNGETDFLSPTRKMKTSGSPRGGGSRTLSSLIPARTSRQSSLSSNEELSEDYSLVVVRNKSIEYLDGNYAEINSPPNPKKSKKLIKIKKKVRKNSSLSSDDTLKIESIRDDIDNGNSNGNTSISNNVNASLNGHQHTDIQVTDIQVTNNLNTITTADTNIDILIVNTNIQINDFKGVNGYTNNVEDNDISNSKPIGVDAEDVDVYTSNLPVVGFLDIDVYESKAAVVEMLDMDVFEYCDVSKEIGVKSSSVGDCSDDDDCDGRNIDDNNYHTHKNDDKNGNNDGVNIIHNGNGYNGINGINDTMKIIQINVENDENLSNDILSAVSSLESLHLTPEPGSKVDPALESLPHTRKSGSEIDPSLEYLLQAREPCSDPTLESLPLTLTDVDIYASKSPVVAFLDSEVPYSREPGSEGFVCLETAAIVIGVQEHAIADLEVHFEDDGKDDDGSGGDDEEEEDDRDEDDDDDDEDEFEGGVEGKEEEEEELLYREEGEDVGFFPRMRDEEEQSDESEENIIHIEPGTLVKVMRKKKWRSAIIKKQHRDGTYKVVYRDGSMESYVSLDRVAVPKGALLAATAADCLGKVDLC